MTKPIISACLITYNQEDYIEQALQGCLNQKLSVEYEIVIGDDASTDNTRVILEKAAAADSRIRLLPPTSNLGMHGNWERTIEACDGQFIAICEGDDFWNDSNKLSKQLQLLENNPTAAACFGNAEVINSNGEKDVYPYVDGHITNLKAEEFFAMDHNPVPTCTVLFRRSCFNKFPKAYYESPFADWILHTLLFQTGPYVYLNESSSCYRKHEAGVWSGSGEEKKLLNKLKVLSIIRSIVDLRYQPYVQSAIRNHLDQLLYFYRSTGERYKYMNTWVKLKLAR